VRPDVDPRSLDRGGAAALGGAPRRARGDGRERCDGYDGEHADETEPPLPHLFLPVSTATAEMTSGRIVAHGWLRRRVLPEAA
jgi:hypothetical protein